MIPILAFRASGKPRQIFRRDRWCPRRDSKRETAENKLEASSLPPFSWVDNYNVTESADTLHSSYTVV